VNYQTLTVDSSDAGLCVVTLNRPGKLNALTDEMFTELRDASNALSINDDVRAIVLTGAGRGFCAGLDLGLAAELPRMSTTTFYKLQQRWANTVAAPSRGPHADHRGGQRRRRRRGMLLGVGGGYPAGQPSRQLQRGLRTHRPQRRRLRHVPYRDRQIDGFAAGPNKIAHKASNPHGAYQPLCLTAIWVWPQFV
jgi:hypothetical protein